MDNDMIAINHYDPMSILRKRYVTICNGDCCAAMLLDRFYGYAKLQADRQWGCSEDEDPNEYDPATYTTIGDLIDDSFGLFDYDDVDNALTLLASKAYIDIISTSQALHIDSPIKIVCHKNAVSEANELYRPMMHKNIQQQNAKAIEKHSQVSSTKEREKSLDREQRRVRMHNNRARKAHLPATLTLEEWVETLTYFDWKCAYCNGCYDLLEHFIPLNHGKGTTRYNCIPACCSCNNIKQAWNPLSSWGPDLASIKDGIVRVQAYLEKPLPLRS